MVLTVFDPRTGTVVAIDVPDRPRPAPATAKPAPAPNPPAKPRAH